MEEDKINTIIKDLEGKDVNAINEMIAEYVSTPVACSPPSARICRTRCGLRRDLKPENLEKQATTLLPERELVTALVMKVHAPSRSALLCRRVDIVNAVRLAPSDGARRDNIRSFCLFLRI